MDDWCIKECNAMINALAAIQMRKMNGIVFLVARMDKRCG
jgi:hypothetical protein